MSASPSPPLRLLAGLVLLAAWLGWSVAAFAGLAQRQDDTGDGVRAAVDSLLAQLPPAAGMARLVIVPSPPGCACTSPTASTSALAQAMHAAGGQVVHWQGAPVPAHTPPVVIVDGRGQVRYAGPATPPPALCGAGDDALARWLPTLLAASDAPAAFLSPDCSC